MKRPTVVIGSLFTVAISLLSQPYASAQSKDELIRRIVEIQNVPRMMDQAQTELRELAQKNVRQVIGKLDGQLTERQQALVEQYVESSGQLFAEALSWQRIEPEVVRIMASVYTEEELAAMLDFYESDVGRKVIEKQPRVLVEISAMTQGMIREVLPEFQELTRKMAREMTQ